MQRTISKHMEWSWELIVVSFANIFMAKIETTLMQQSKTEPTGWRRYIDNNIFSFWDNDKKDVDHFIKEANKFHPTNKFTKSSMFDFNRLYMFFFFFQKFYSKWTDSKF